MIHDHPRKYIFVANAIKRHKSKQGQSLVWNVNNGKFFIEKAVRTEKHMIEKFDLFWKYQKYRFFWKFNLKTNIPKVR